MISANTTLVALVLGSFEGILIAAWDALLRLHAGLVGYLLLFAAGLQDGGELFGSRAAFNFGAAKSRFIREAK